MTELVETAIAQLKTVLLNGDMNCPPCWQRATSPAIFPSEKRAEISPFERGRISGFIVLGLMKPTLLKITVFEV